MTEWLSFWLGSLALSRGLHPKVWRSEWRVEFFLRQIFSSSGERCQLLEIFTGEKYRILYSVYHHRVPFNCSFQDPFEAVFRLGQSRNLRVKHRKNVRDTL